MAHRQLTAQSLAGDDVGLGFVVVVVLVVVAGALVVVDGPGEGGEHGWPAYFRGDARERAGEATRQ